MFTNVSVEEIHVGERRRQEFGDIDGLAESIQKYGLFHPIVVDGENNLVAGERRLRAALQLQWDEIPVRRYSELSEDERREIELEENLRRKDLTPLEAARKVVQLAETAAKIIKDDSLSNLDNESKRKRGGQPKHVTEVKVAERLGIPRTTINHAKDHVAAVQKYPEMAALNFPQKDAITIAKNLDALPDEQRSEARSKLIAMDQNVTAILADKPPMPAPKPKAEKTASDRWTETVREMSRFFSSINQTGGVTQLTRRWTPQQSKMFLSELQAYRDNLDNFITELEERVYELTQQAG